jgi:hypothetical protein
MAVGDVRLDGEDLHAGPDGGRASLYARTVAGERGPSHLAIVRRRPSNLRSSRDPWVPDLRSLALARPGHEILVNCGADQSPLIRPASISSRLKRRASAPPAQA